MARTGARTSSGTASEIVAAPWPARSATSPASGGWWWRKRAVRRTTPISRLRTKSGRRPATPTANSVLPPPMSTKASGPATAARPAAPPRNARAPSSSPPSTRHGRAKSRSTAARNAGPSAARLTTVVRLGQGVDRSGRLHPEAVARTRACLREYAPRLEAYGPARRFLVATSVLRDAADGPAFLAAVERDFALPWRVLGGEEEGALAFRGGAAGLAAVAGPLALVDIGGGSTEFAVGVAGRRPDFVRSLDIGVVRLTERFLHHDPPLAGEVADLAGHVAATISEAVPDDVRAPVRAMVGVAGTYTTLVAHKLGLRRYDPV